MQSTSSSVFPLATWFYPIPINFLHHTLHSHHSHVSFRKPTVDFRCFSLHTTHHYSTLQRHQTLTNKTNASHPFQDSPLFYQFHSPFSSSNITNQNPEPQDEEQEEFERQSAETQGVLFTNMWWVDLKAALGQRINVEGVVSSVSVFVKDRHLVLPHVIVPDIRYIDWGELKKRGFKGVVFDKDNTITAPYSLTLWPPLSSSLKRCKAVFRNMIMMIRKRGRWRGQLELKSLGIVGDRPFTDIVYGNRNGFLTILTEPLSLAEEPFLVKQVRKLEMCLVNLWFRRGLKPTSHNLLPDVAQCVKDPPPP
ncbi:uncharacterized protein LOC110815037 isoform X2 [Carica papaya]|uniref:uncharacterized protein LOC110815037 isoform X2 n=1 Tax=Carica papaya TaxID=3649 RepID=UPI000B8CBDA2|nr:uncharacterized protein LOC110815037 isoform X2 [Carica papaya]